MRFQPRQQGQRIYNPAKGTVVESRNVTFLELPAYTLPSGITLEDYKYEGDILRFTSALHGPKHTEDAFDGWDYGRITDNKSEIELLRQEIRILRHNNAVREELQGQTQSPATNSEAGTPPGSPTSMPGVAPDEPGVAPSGVGPSGAPSPTAGIGSPVPGPEVTRAGTRNNPNTSDVIDNSLIPSSLRSTLRFTSAKDTACIDPRALDSTQLLSIAGNTRHVNTSGIADFAHSDRDPFAVPRAFVYATGTPAQKGFSEEEDRAIKTRTATRTPSILPTTLSGKKPSTRSWTA